MGESYGTITTDELQEQLEKGLPEDTIIIDVREDEEVETGMIPGAKHIRLGYFAGTLRRTRS